MTTLEKTNDRNKKPKKENPCHDEHDIHKNNPNDYPFEKFLSRNNQSKKNHPKKPKNISHTTQKLSKAHGKKYTPFTREQIHLETYYMTIKTENPIFQLLCFSKKNFSKRQMTKNKMIL